MTNIIHFILNLLMYIILYACGKKAKKAEDARSYWRSLVPAIIFVTLNEGLRFGRGIDYNNYFYFYNDIISGVRTDFDFIFEKLCYLSAFLGGGYQVFILIMSFILIISICFVGRIYKELSPFLLPLLTFLSLGAENLIRWYLAFSFLLIGIYYLLQKNIRNYVFFSLMAILCHLGVLPMVFIFYLFSRINKVILTPILCIVIYILAVFVFKTEMMLNFSSMINLFNIAGKYEDYQTNIEYWLVSGALGGEIQNTLDMSILLFTITVLFWGYRIVKQQDSLRYYYAYNICSIAFCTYPMMHPIEIADRYNQLMFFFLGIVAANVLLNINKYIYIRKLFYYITIVIFLNYGRIVLFQSFVLNPNHVLYVWDKHGRNVLDNNKYYFKYFNGK